MKRQEKNSPVCLSQSPTSKSPPPLFAFSAHAFFWLSQARLTAVSKSGYQIHEVSIHSFLLLNQGPALMGAGRNNLQKYRHQPQKASPGPPSL